MMVMKERFPIGWQNGVDFVQKHPKGTVPQLQDGLFVDLYTPIIALIEAGRKSGVLSSDDTLGSDTRRLTSDGIHPNWSGSLIMAATILEHINAPDLISSAALDAVHRSTVSAQGCTIVWKDSPAGVVEFERKDAALPWPTPPEGDLALKIPGFDPGKTLNRYELKITGLKAAAYKLSIDDQQIGNYSQTQLAAGINLSFVQCGPIYKQGQKLLAAVKEKNDTFFNRWRNVEIGAPLLPNTSAADRRRASRIRGIRFRVSAFSSAQTACRPELL